MRLPYLLLIPALAGGSAAFAEDNRPVGTCAENEWCLPVIPHDGVCPHPSVIFDIPGGRYESPPVSRDDESRCIPLAQPFAERRGDELLLTFRNGAVETYKDAPAGEDDENYVFYDYFPEHRLFLVNVNHDEAQDWLLISQMDGRKEKIVAPPRYSPDRKWLASVNWIEALDEGNNGFDIVSAAFDSPVPSFHYRPSGYALFEFVRWESNDRLKMKVTIEAGQTFPVEVVRENDTWHLKWPLPTPPP